MTLKDDILADTIKTFQAPWSTTDANVVPTPESVTLGNSAKFIDRATVLYADLSGSTSLVDGKTWQFAGEVYKTFLQCAARLIREAGGTVTAYDGDRIMALFVDNRQCNNAVRCGFNINYAVKNIIMPALKKQYNTSYQIRHIVGVDCSPIRAARIGVRGNNDLVWIGNAANHAAKLTELDANYPTWITKTVLSYLDKDLKIYNEDKPVWESRLWTNMNNMEIYRSTCWCIVN